VVAKARTKVFIGVALALLLGLGLRLLWLDRQSLWLDELLSLEASAGRGQADQLLPTGQWLTPPALTSIDPDSTLLDVGRKLGADSHPPGFYVVLRLWRQLAGDGAWGLRLLTVLLSTAGIAAVGWLAWELELTLQESGGGGTGTGDGKLSPVLPVMAAVLAAGSIPQIYFAQELRMYAALALVTASTAALALRALRHRHEWQDDMALFTVAGLVSLFTHYAACLPLGLMLIVMWTRRHLRWGVPAAVILAGVAYWFAWGDGLAAQRSALAINRAVAARGESATSGLLSCAGSTVWATQMWGAAPWGRSGTVPWADWTLGLLSIGTSVWLVLRIRSAAVVLIVLWANIGWVVAAVGGGGAVAQVRYQLVAAPGVFVTVALLTRTVGRPLLWGCGLAAVLATSMLAGWINDPYRAFKPDWQPMVSALSTADSPASAGSPSPVILWSLLPENRYLLGGAVLAIMHYDPHPGRRFLLLDASYNGPLPASGWFVNLTPQFGQPTIPVNFTQEPSVNPLRLPFTVQRFTALAGDRLPTTAGTLKP
jgi:hypothetical protein